MAKDQYKGQNPVEQYPQPNSGEQKIDPPGLDSEMPPSQITATKPTAAPAG